MNLVIYFYQKIIKYFNFCILDNKKPTKKNILKHIRYEFRARNRVSRDLIVDAQAAKVLCEHLCLYPHKDGELRGFIQEIRIDPFGMLLISDIQVFLLNIIYQ